MASKSSVSMDIPESQWTEDEFCAVGTETDRIPSCKSSASSGVKAGISSGSSVHELLECPVCTNSMFPPIHQVLSLWLLFSVLSYE